MKLQGIFAAAATPFDHQGDLYRVKFQHNLEKWNRTTLSGYLIATSTGEGPFLSFEEKVQLFRWAAGWTGQGKLVIADTSAESVIEAARLARAAAEAGCHAVISRVPNHYKTMMYGPDNQMLYLRALADRSPLPVLLHNAPPYLGVDLAPETAARLAHHPNIQGIVEEGTPAQRIAQLRELLPKEFSLLAASAGAVLESLQAGANGAALAIASAAPYSVIALWEAYRTREREAAEDWQHRLAQPNILVTDLYGIPALKTAMDQNGYYGGPPRLPLSTLPPAAAAEVTAAFENLKS